MENGGKRYCVVTPYFKGSIASESLLDSVARQTVAVDHILVADGFPQPWLSSKPVRHVMLDRAHGDYGNVARGVGALLAVAEKYSGIAFLDADNWYDEDHIECCLAAARTSPDCVFVAAQRKFVRPDGSVMVSVRPAEVPHARAHRYELLFLSSERLSIRPSLVHDAPRVVGIRRSSILFAAAIEWFGPRGRTEGDGELSLHVRAGLSRERRGAASRRKAQPELEQPAGLD